MPPRVRTPWSSRRFGRRTATAGALFVVVLVGAFCAYAATGVLGNNTHTVMAGKLYRSAQLSQPDLDALLAQDRIACVLSLRKDDPPAPEFAAEKDHLRTIGIAHANIPFSPCKLPPPDSVVALIERFDRGPYPMLIHCEDGADRTGFAAVIWLMLYGDKSLAEARASDLSIWTGHFSFGQAHAMNDFFDLYERTAHGQGLREWVTASYPALYDSARRPATRAEVLAHDHN